MANKTRKDRDSKLYHKGQKSIPEQKRKQTTLFNKPKLLCSRCKKRELSIGQASGWCKSCIKKYEVREV